MRRMNFVLTETYCFSDDWRVDITFDVGVDGVYAEAYLYEQTYGVKSLMFGMILSVNGMTKDDFRKMVERNFDEYKEMYCEDYAY